MGEIGGNHGPVFIDLHGTARRLDINGSKLPGGKGGADRRHPEGPMWLQGLRGHLPLWLAFWGGFFFGHGLLIAFSVGIILIAVVVGMTIEPGNVDDSFTKASLILIPVGTVAALFVAWASVAVWRSAVNTEHLRWTITARLVIVCYLAAFAALLYHLFG